MVHIVTLNGAHQRAIAHRAIDRAPQGYRVRFEEPARTLDQNAKLWAVLSDISRARPEGREHTPEVWKAVFMQALGHEQQFAMGLDGAPFPLGWRSSKLTKAQFSELLEFIFATCATRGWNIQWSEPEAVA